MQNVAIVDRRQKHAVVSVSVMIVIWNAPVNSNVMFEDYKNNTKLDLKDMNLVAVTINTKDFLFFFFLIPFKVKKQLAICTYHIFF